MDNLIENIAPIYVLEIGDTVFNIILDDSFYSNGIPPTKSPKNIHFHTKHEMFIFTNGKISLFLNNKNTLTFINDAIIIPPFLNHYSIREQGVSYRVLFSFSKKKSTKKLTNTYSFFNSIFNVDTIKQIETYYKNSYLDEIYHLIQNEKHDRFVYEKIKLLLNLFFFCFIPNESSITKNTTNLLNINYISQIEQIIFNHFNENITLKQLAKTLKLSVRQTSRIVQTYFHKPLSILLTDKKMIVACQMLTESNIKITKITEYLNFNSESYFFRLFKKYHGCTPLQYRIKHKNKLK